MDLPGAYELFGLDPDAATRADLDARYRALRKPLLKRLNRAEPGQEPPELLGQLESVESAYKLLKDAVAEPAPEPAETSQHGRRSTGRVTLETGALLLGRYEVKALATHRPEGDTYRVFDRIRRSEVGLKIVDEALLRGKGRRALLHRGLLDASRLSHPHLARVLDIHPLQSTYAVTQELPAGRTLWDLLYGEPGDGPTLTPDVVVRVAEQATHALAYAHTLMPHAALRPESLWISPEGNVKVADLGFVDLQGPMRTKRLSRAKLGTAYWAPEQFKDDAAGAEQSDQYALALMCYEAIQGEPAAGRVGRVRDEQKAYPTAFKKALERALSSKPARRFPDLEAFGEAAFAGYAHAGQTPAAVPLLARLVPALILVLAFAGFALSPVGRQAASAIGDLAGLWDDAVARDTADDLELRRLRALATRLTERQDRLDEASREELERLRGVLWTPTPPDAATRSDVRRDLTQVVKQVVGTSRHRAEKALERMVEQLTAIQASRAALAQAADASIASQRQAVRSAPADARQAPARVLVRTMAARERALRAIDARLDALTSDPALASGLRAMLEAERALAIGDDTATGRAYDTAHEALARIGDPAEVFATGLTPWSAPTEAEAAPALLDPAARTETLDAVLQRAEELSTDPDLVNVFETQRKEAINASAVAWSVSDEGWFTLSLRGAARAAMLAGTWQERGGARTLRAVYWDGGLLDPPVEVLAERGAEMPGLSDLRAALARVPHSARAIWSVVRAGARPLEAPAFEVPERVVRAGEVAVAATLAGSEATGLITASRRYEPTEGRVEASVRVSGDVLRTWIRVHALMGLRSSPAAWLALRVDGIKPRVQLLEPRADTVLEPGQEVIVRFFAYDSNLTTLEVQGTEESLRRDDVYVLVERTLRAPETGTLTLPVRAVDAAGNVTQVDWTWSVR
ncbi:MAG: protein kinase [Planctomycetota bacterium]|nr:protein kinase [Planctomycetota bacterium]